MEDNNICTVLLISYNHKPYIKKAIESVLEQKTDYPFIIKIFDDCSTDGTIDIIKEYACKYPNKIFPFISEKNQGAQSNFWNAFSSVKTKYCIILECDDYWCDVEKLDLQINALEKNPNCSFCSTNNIVKVLEDKYFKYKNNTINIEPGVFQKNIISYNDIKNRAAGFMTHISTRMYRTSCLEMDKIKYKETLLFDMAQFFYLLSKGDMYWINKICSVYVKTGKGASRNFTSVMSNFLSAMAGLNEDTNYQYTKSIIKYFNAVSALWIKCLEQTENNTHNIINTNKKSLFKRLKHYLLPPIILDLFNLPRNVIRFIKNRKKKIS